MVKSVVRMLKIVECMLKIVVCVPNIGHADGLLE